MFNSLMLRYGKAANLALVPIIFFAFFVRLFFVFANPIAVTKDALQYDQMALNLVNGKGFVDETGSPTAFIPPLYYLFLASIYHIFGHSYLVVRILQAILGSLTCFIIYKIAEIIFSRKIGLISTLISSVYPAFTFFYYGPAGLLTETLFIFLFCLGVLLSLKSFIKNSLILSMTAGIFLGLATLTRPIGLFIPLVIFAWLIMVRTPFKKLFNISLPSLLAFLTILSPWIIRNYIVFHAIVPASTAGGINFYASHSSLARGLGEGWHQALQEDEALKRQGLDEAQRSDFFLKKGIKFLKDNPDKIFYLFFRNLMSFWDISCDAWGDYSSKYNISFAILLPFGLLGVIIALKDKNKIFSSLLLFIIIYFSFLHAIMHSAYRYRVVIEPFIIIFTVLGMVFIFNKFKNKIYFCISMLVYLSAHVVIFCRYKHIFAYISNALKCLGLH